MIRTAEHRAYPIPVALNLAIIAAQLAAIAGCFVAAAHASRWWHLALLAAAFGLVMNSVYSIIHEAEHNMLLPSHRLNDFLGAVMTLFFPAPFHLLRQGHIGHHLRNRSDDEAFDLFFDGETRLWKCVQLYGTLTGVYWMIVALSNVVVLALPFIFKRKYFRFDRPSMAFMDSLNPAYWRLIRLEGAAAIALHVAVVLTLHIPVVNYLLMYYGFGLSWSAMQYVHHYGTERHVLRGARNLWLWGPIDRLLLNHNAHRTHHEQPTVPWVYLPRLEREAQRDVRGGAAKGFLPWAYIRMWRGPRRATEHVENRYAGRVIQ